jgi:hypothetical protein
MLNLEYKLVIFNSSGTLFLTLKDLFYEESWERIKVKC